MRPTRAELGFAIRQMMRSCRSASLSTASAKNEAWPYVSLVTVAIDINGSPVMLFSSLSDHTRNIKVDNRASLLFERASNHSNPQRGPRVSVLGKISLTTKQEHIRPFLNKHREAKKYAAFGDFDFFHMSIHSAHWVGGFAKAQWLSGRFVTGDIKSSQAIAASAGSIVEHMNMDHSDTVELLATKLLGRKGGRWQMTSVDPEGAELMLGYRSARLSFPKPATDAESVRVLLINMAHRARA